MDEELQQRAAGGAQPHLHGPLDGLLGGGAVAGHRVGDRGALRVLDVEDEVEVEMAGGAGVAVAAEPHRDPAGAFGQAVADLPRPAHGRAQASGDHTEHHVVRRPHAVHAPPLGRDPSTPARLVVLIISRARATCAPGAHSRHHRPLRQKIYRTDLHGYIGLFM